MSKLKTKTKSVKKNQTENTGDMYFKIGRTDFVNAINIVSIALPSKEYNDAKAGIMLDARYDGRVPMLYLTVNSLDVFVRHGVKLADDIEEGFVVPNGAFMRKFVKSIKNAVKSPIEVFYDGSELQITSGTEYNGSAIKHYDPVGFVNPPTDDEIKSLETISVPANVIKESLTKVAFACSNDTSVIELTAVLIEQNKNGMVIIGTDSNKFSYLGFKTKVRNPKSVMIGVKYLQSLKAILDALEIKDTQVLDLYLSDDKLYMVAGNTTVGIQIYGGTHPIQNNGGYEQFVIPASECDVAITLEKDKFIPILNLAIAHNNSNVDVIRMRLSKSTTAILANSDLCDNKFELDFDAEVSSKKKIIKKPIVFDFSPELLIGAMNSIKDKTFKLYLHKLEDNGDTYGAGNMVIFRPANENSYEFVHVFSLS